MARIRSIKPEFPQSESMGRVSRDARLTFIQLWTLADDEGRLRGNSRMLASLLFPYDDDAKDLIDRWLDELEREHCIQRYRVNGDNYVQIANWLIHQKIDKPSKSKIPAFDESSRVLANPREVSSEDQGSRIKDQGKEEPPKPPAADASVSGKPDDARELLAYLNAKTGKHFRCVPASLDPIRARLKDATPEQVRAVIDDRVKAWASDEAMARYLRPETLFRASKFEGYLGNLGASKPAGRPGQIAGAVVDWSATEHA